MKLKMSYCEIVVAFEMDVDDFIKVTDKDNEVNCENDTPLYEHLKRLL